MIEFLIGVDGGGSGTRARLAHPDGRELGQGASGPSALSQGIPNAWAAVEAAIADAFANAGLAPAPRAAMGLGLGLAGVHHPQWAAAFIAADPGYGQLALASDGHTTVLGAHRGQAGAIIALGTGSVGEVRLADGRHVEVGGWGFPSGDEAGGAWIGLHAVNHLQHSLDGRVPASAFSNALALACGAGGHSDSSGDTGSPNGANGAVRAQVQQWLAQANPPRYAQLAPVVLQHAPSNPAAHAIVLAAGQQEQRMADALDASGALPLALCGGLAAPLRPYLPAALLSRLTPPHGDSAAGALHLIREHSRAQPLP
ncbi:MAG: BadF/BadG/BcrA/BcrD ATPase family protein [Duganella sp.]